LSNCRQKTPSPSFFITEWFSFKNLRSVRIISVLPRCLSSQAPLFSTGICNACCNGYPWDTRNVT
jgi:hypothetical protein